MQITPLRPGGLGVDRSPMAGGAAAPTRVADSPSTTAPARTASAAPPVHAGVHGLDAQRNTRVAGAQQTLDFLDRLTPRLRNLQTDLQRVVAGQPVPTERLDNQRARVAQLWSERPAGHNGSGGALDSQLAYSATQPATRSFTVRGLEQAAQARETLTLAVGLPSTARPPVRVLLDPQATPTAQARAFDQALAPLGVQAEADAASGGMRFRVAETRWPQVRDGLAVQGEGRQFAGGRLHRVATAAQPDALTPQQWAWDAESGAPQALQQIGRALQRAEGARDGARAVLGADRAALASAAPAQDGSWAAQFGEDFAARLDGQDRARAGSYGQQAALGAALWGLDRQRVERLLDAG